MASEETRKRVVQTRYWKELRRMLQDCGGIVQENGLNIAKIAAAAGTHPRTTKNLFDGTTVFPHYRTVWCNVASLGWGLSPVERPRPITGDLTALAAISKVGKTRKKKPRGKKQKGKK